MGNRKKKESALDLWGETFSIIGKGTDFVITQTWVCLARSAGSWICFIHGPWLTRGTANLPLLIICSLFHITVLKPPEDYLA